MYYNKKTAVFSIFRCRCTPSCKPAGCLSVPEDIAHFMDTTRQSVSHVTLTREVTDEDADVPMLSMDTPGTQYIGMAKHIFAFTVVV